MVQGDDDLVRALRDGELGAFKALYARHHQAMLRIARQVLGHHEDAEDAVQDAFLSVYRTVRRFRGDAAFTTWLYRIVVTSSLKLRRRRRSCPETPESAAAVGDPRAADAACLDLRSALRQEIAALPLRQRMVFALTEVEGFEPREVARILGLEPGTVRYHLCMAKTKLRHRLRPVLEADATERRVEAPCAPAGGRDAPRS
ncbi:MAG: sigma-70 family RNA polymerase sigma factor [Planctomycetota bacterium]